MIVLAAGLVISTSWLIIVSLPVRGRVAALLAFYLLSLSNIILSGYVLGVFYLLNQVFGYLAIHALLFALAIFLWMRRGRPSLWGPLAGMRGALSARAFKNAVIQHPDLAALAAGMAFFYVFSFVLGVTVPPNNYDSLSTHLARVGYWLQFGSYLPWPTYSLTQVIYPLNAQLPIAWLVLFTGGDRLAAFPQWVSVLVCGLSAFGIARLLGHGLRPALFAALITLGFPLLVLQSSTPQTDLVTAGYYAAAVYLLVLGIEKRDLPALGLMILAVGLGAGTKKSFLLLMPGFVVLAGLVGWQVGRDFIRRAWRWGVAAVLVLAVLGASYIIINLRAFGQPLGPQGYTTVLFGQTDPASLIGRTLVNTPRLVYQALDPSGLPRPFGGYSHKLKARIVRPLVEAAGFQMEGTDFTAPGHVFDLDKETINEESNAWFGPLSVLLLLPALFYTLRRSLQQRQSVTLGLIFTLLVFFPLDAAARPGWDPYQGRYFAPVFVTAAPLMAVWFERRRVNLFSWAITALTLVVAGYTLFYNPAKPTLGKWADDIGVWRKDRIFLMTAQHQREREMHYMVNNHVPQDATLGIASLRNFTEFILFGEHFTRRVMPVYPIENVADPAWLRAEGINYLLVMGSVPYVPAPGYTLIAQVEGWQLYQWGAPP